MTDKQQADKGNVVKVGIGMLVKPTPEWMKYILRTVLYVSMAWAFLAPTFTNLSPELLAGINAWLLRINGLLSITIKFFGWTPAEN